MIYTDIYIHLVCLLRWRHLVIKWKHFRRYWPIVRGIQRSPLTVDPHPTPITPPYKGQQRGALMCSLIYAGDLRRHCVHYDVIVIYMFCLLDIGFHYFDLFCVALEDLTTWRDNKPEYVFYSRCKRGMFICVQPVAHNCKSMYSIACTICISDISNAMCSPIYIYPIPIYTYIYIPYIYIHIMDFTLQTHYIWWFTVMLDHDKGTLSESMNYECWRPFNSSLRKLSAQDIQCSVCHSVHLDNCGVDVTDQSLCLNHRSLLTWVFIHVISWQWVSDWLVAVSLSKATSENCFLLENRIDMCSTSYSQYIYIIYI